MKRFITLACFSFLILQSAVAQLPIANFTVTNDHLCPGTCTNFLNLSINATSYQWIFQGAHLLTSTDQDPSIICYTFPGTYDVTLIAINSLGTDTLLIQDYIVVYPFPALMVAIMQNGDTLFATQGYSSYQWYYDMNIIPGATNGSYVASQEGDYWVVVTDINGCEWEAALLDIYAGNDELLENSISIFPNPGSEELFISGPYNGNFEVNIYNCFGQNVLTSFSKKRINIQGLPSGMYTVVVSQEENMFRSMFLKN